MIRTPNFIAGAPPALIQSGRRRRAGRPGTSSAKRIPTPKTVVVVRNAPPLAPDLPPDLPPDPPSVEYPVRLTFLLPDTVLVSLGPHGFNTAVLPGNVVRIRGREAKHCFAMAREFFAVVAWDRAFTCRATITRDDDPRTFGRHLTVVRGALVISGGMVEPKVYDVG